MSDDKICCSACNTWRDLEDVDRLGPFYCFGCGVFIGIKKESGFFVCGFQTDEHEKELRALQDRICAAVEVHATAHEQVETPPFVAHVFLFDPENPERAGGIGVSAGTVWRVVEDRWPTVDEIAEALAYWRDDKNDEEASRTNRRPPVPRFHVEWARAKETKEEDESE